MTHIVDSYEHLALFTAIFQDIIIPGNYVADIESLSVYKTTVGDTTRYTISAHAGERCPLIAFFEVRDHSEVVAW
jgi:hypothetical protein